MFVLVGIVVGAAAARCRVGSGPPSSATAPVVVRKDPTATRPSPSSTGSAPAHRVSQREIAPTDPRYDPVAWSQEDDRLSFKDIFDSEPRDAAFAPVLEQRIRKTIDLTKQELHLEDKIHNVRTECRTLSCVTSFDVSRADGKAIHEATSGILLGDSQIPELLDGADETRSEIRIYSLCRPAARDESYHKRMFDEAVRPALEFWKRRLLEKQPEGEAHDQK